MPLIQNEYTIYSNATNQVAQTGAMAQTALAKIASIGQGHLLMYFLSRFLAHNQNSPPIDSQKPDFGRSNQ